MVIGLGRDVAVSQHNVEPGQDRARIDEMPKVGHVLLNCVFLGHLYIYFRVVLYVFVRVVCIF